MKSAAGLWCLFHINVSLITNTSKSLGAACLWFLEWVLLVIKRKPVDRNRYTIFKMLLVSSANGRNSKNKIFHLLRLVPSKAAAEQVPRVPFPISRHRKDFCQFDSPELSKHSLDEVIQSFQDNNKGKENSSVPLWKENQFPLQFSEARRSSGGLELQKDNNKPNIHCGRDIFPIKKHGDGFSCIMPINNSSFGIKTCNNGDPLCFTPSMHLSVPRSSRMPLLDSPLSDPLFSCRFNCEFPETSKTEKLFKLNSSEVYKNSVRWNRDGNRSRTFGNQSSTQKQKVFKREGKQHALKGGTNERIVLSSWIRTQHPAALSTIQLDDPQRSSIARPKNLVRNFGAKNSLTKNLDLVDDPNEERNVPLQQALESVINFNLLRGNLKFMSGVEETNLILPTLWLLSKHPCEVLQLQDDRIEDIIKQANHEARLVLNGAKVFKKPDILNDVYHLLTSRAIPVEPNTLKNLIETKKALEKKL